ncbi:MAG TPA: hypothetical protein VIO32_04115 [Candidatus Baltobacteraceae bacterium]
MTVYDSNRLWQRLNLTAQQLAQDKSLPSTRHAEAIIAQILREEGAAIPEDYTVASLAEELRRATRHCPPYGVRRRLL